MPSLAKRQRPRHAAGWYRRDTTRARLALASCAALLVLAGCPGREAAQGEAPDVVLVVIDSLRADRVNHPSAAERLPNLTRLAADSVVFERASSPATWCIPGHASLLTGRWPSFHGAERSRRAEADLAPQPIDAEAPTLAELLKARELATASFTSGRDDLSAAHGFARGFDDVVSEPALETAPDVARAAGAWLAEQTGPVFLFVGLDDLRHAEVAPAGIGSPGDVARAEITNAAARRGGLSATRKGELMAAYDRGLAGVDAAVGEILGALQATGRYAGALVIVTADHGELLGEHGLVGHGWPPFEGALNVPLIVKYPEGRDAGDRVERRVSTLGVFATVLEAEGIDLPEGAQSRPLDDRHPVWAEDVDRKGRRVRAGYDGLRMKIIRIVDGDVDVACTYDLFDDPFERKPACGTGEDAPLERAMASFARQPRPGEPASGIARAEEDAASPSEGDGSATN